MIAGLRLILAVSFAARAAALAVDVRGVFVHLFEWHWPDVAAECENFLGPKGFAAVQVSPPQEHIQGSQWWTRYQPVSYNLTSRSGNEAEFRDMVKRCTAVGVQVIADSVVNHMAGGSGVGVAGTRYSSRSFPGVYGQQDFHHLQNDMNSNCGVSDYFNQQNVQTCDLSGLPDLDTGSGYVQNTIAAYLNSMYRMGVRGFRIDAAKHQEASQMNAYLKQLPADAFVFGEVIEGANEAVKPEMYEQYCWVTEFDWASEVAPNVQNEGKMQFLNNVGQSWNLISSDRAVIFTDNHDTQRSGAARVTYKDGPMYYLLNLVLLSGSYGFPKVMSSYYFNDKDQGPPQAPANAQTCGDGRNWVCEHRWAGIAGMVNWRNQAAKAEMGSGDATNFQQPPLLNWITGKNGNGIAFSRGVSATKSAAFIALNRDGQSWDNQRFQTGLPAGSYCNVIEDADTNTCRLVTVAGDGTVTLTVPSMNAVAMHLGSRKTAASVGMITV